MSELVKCDDIDIRDVWDHNLEKEFSLLRDIVDQYPYIAMDTEFPGVVIKRVVDYMMHFPDLKANVDMLKLIQLGLTFSDENGNLPTCGGDKPCIWQFNFREFDMRKDSFVSESINLLKRSGIDFEKNNEMGIDCKRFAELLMSSGIVLNEDVHWVAFHCPYDFGYLLKALTCRCLPDSVAGFFRLINIFFPIIYDVKYMMKFCNGLYGGLDRVAQLLGVKRIGNSHQAGSDTLLTLRTFMKLKADYFNGSVEKYAGFLHGLAIENV